MHGRSSFGTYLLRAAPINGHGAAVEAPRSIVVRLLVACDRLFACPCDPFKVLRVRTPGTDGVIDAVAKAVRKDRVVDRFPTAVLFGDWEVFVSRHPIAQLESDRLKVRRPSEFFRAAARRHLASEFGDVSLLGCSDENLLRAEPC